MTRDEAICRWRDLTHSTVYTAAQAREQAEAIRRVVVIKVGDVDAECAYRAARGLSMYDDERGR
jgi:hypothetical protein